MSLELKPEPHFRPVVVRLAEERDSLKAQLEEALKAFHRLASIAGEAIKERNALRAQLLNQGK